VPILESAMGSRAIRRSARSRVVADIETIAIDGSALGLTVIAIAAGQVDRAFARGSVRAVHGARAIDHRAGQAVNGAGAAQYADRTGGSAGLRILGNGLAVAIDLFTPAHAGLAIAAGGGGRTRWRRGRRRG
jgi:hypothetical protein